MVSLNTAPNPFFIKYYDFQTINIGKIKTRLDYEKLIEM
jgi:hypothetical protein